MRLSEQRRLFVSPRAGHAERARGFTLMETVVAMLIMMIVGLAAVSLFAFSMRNNSLAGTRLAALALAQQRMERLRNVPFDDLSLDAGTINETLSVTSGSYTVQTTVCTTVGCGGSDTIKRITLQVTPVNASNSRNGADSTVVLTAERTAITTGPYLQ